MPNPFPTPGTTGVIGFVSAVTNTGAPLIVQAWVLANGYATPDANIVAVSGDPLKFEVIDPPQGNFNVGDGITFDVVQGTYAPGATNVARK